MATSLLIPVRIRSPQSLLTVSSGAKLGVKFAIQNKVFLGLKMSHGDLGLQDEHTEELFDTIDSRTQPRKCEVSHGQLEHVHDVYCLIAGCYLGHRSCNEAPRPDVGFQAASQAP